jgi:glycogen operon protein
MPKAIVSAPALAKPGDSLTPWSETVIYELHVRGFSMRNPGVPEALRGTFAGLAHPASVAYLKALGVTAVEVLPPCAWIEEQHLAKRGLTNYWGYNTVGFLAPDARLAPGGWAEVASCVAALADAGIETIIDIVLNHTGEGDGDGVTLSLRGLDNASYFQLGPDGVDANDTGCGNTLALNRPAGLRLAMECLRAWARFGGVHGFRFDLATVLGRTPGFDPAAALLLAIGQDPLLSRLKMIAEPWDMGWGGYQLGAFPAAWGEWNDKYRDDVRRFWRGDAGGLGPLATRLAGSADVFTPHRRPSRSVNFVTAHDGFTLADLVAYTAKRNFANGEDNRDGTNDNHSWNNGIEGPADDAAIMTARLADQRALLATLLLSRGTPILSMGAECGQSQGGNNNGYAQDNETSWLDWSRADPGLLAWTQKLLALRHRHAGFRTDAFLSGDDVAWLRPDGTPMGGDDWRNGDALVMLLGDVGLAINRGPETALQPPPVGGGQDWFVVADSAAPEAEPVPALSLKARSVAVLAIQPTPTARRGSDPAILARLAHAAGIAPQWWETTGTHHLVSDDSKRAILRAMHLPADSTGEARDSLAMLAQASDLRPLPDVLVVREGSAIHLPLRLADGHTPRSCWLTLAFEDGRYQPLRASAADAVLDGRRWLIPLPDMPVGRHRVWCDDRPEMQCHLTVAPQRCYLPQGRRFGVSAQLYTIRRDGDQGIGDFTTLAELARATKRAGGAMLGLNPMGAMFADQRERASPYQPSDRRFLDPIYLDVPEAGAAGSAALVDYPAVWAAKLPFLAQRFLQGRADPAFAEFVAHGGEALRRFAVFEALREGSPDQTWTAWPDALRDPASAEVAGFEQANPELVAFIQYQQYLCDQQLSASAGLLDIGLIRDLAVGCAPDGAEAWALGDQIAHGVSIGAPPDPFSAEGQVWGLPPPNPHRMKRHGYRDFAHLLASNMRHAGGVRIDHVMGLARLFWVPEGGRGADGAYVSYPLDDLLGQVALESRRARALVIGEDLGTVPEGFREALAARDILTYRVLLLEREGHGFKPASAYPALAVASVSTHDLPTFAGWRAGADIDERLALGQSDATRAEGEHIERAAEVSALRAMVGEDLSAGAHRFVAETPCDLVYVQADDLSGETQAVNLPGTDRERPNWRRRLAVPLEELFDNPVATPILDALRSARPNP